MTTSIESLIAINLRKSLITMINDIRQKQYNIPSLSFDEEETYMRSVKDRFDTVVKSAMMDLDSPNDYYGETLCYNFPELYKRSHEY